MRTITVLLSLLWGSSAFGFFASTSCSSPEGDYRYSYFMAWDHPEETHWWWRGEEQSKPSASSETSPRVVLFHYSDPMVETTIYSSRVRVEFSPASLFEDYIICKASSGF